MEKPQIVRPCGMLEQASTSRHSLGLYRGVSNTCQYQLCQALSASAWKQWVCTALTDVVKSQPFLRVGLVDEDTMHACYVYLPSIDLETQVEIHLLQSETEEEHDSKVLRLLEKRHDLLWPDTGKIPPWKVAVFLRDEKQGDFNRADVMFSYHHAIGDGTSGKIFQENLLRALRQHTPWSSLSNTMFDSSILHFPEPPILPGPQESMIKFTVSWRYFLNEVWEKIRPAFLAPAKEKHWAGEVICLGAPYKTNLRLIQIDTVTRDRLLAACRMNSTSLTGLVHALALLSMARQLPSEKAFVGGTPISLRPYVTDPNFNTETSMHDLVTARAHPFGAATVGKLQELLQTDKRELRLEDRVWQLAEEIKGDLKRKQETLPADDIVGMLHWISDWRAWIREKEGKPRDWTWELSNVGNFRGSIDDAGVVIRRQIFSQSASVAGVAICLSMAGCGGEKAVTIAATWQEGAVSRELVEGLLEDLDGWCKNLATCGRLRGRA